MVPFADCLNHANVQTKYDYDVDNNGYFRLFPTGANCYKQGFEVFNSYGRRPNSNLLIDYGFSMIYNEWDDVEMILEMIPTDNTISSTLSEKLRIFMHIQQSKYQPIRISVFDFPLEVSIHFICFYLFLFIFILFFFKFLFIFIFYFLFFE